MTKEKKQEFTLRITQANRTGLIVILYEMTLVFLEEAQAAFAQGSIELYQKEIKHAQNCLDELIASLAMEYELARNLHSLYYFFKRQLSSARIQQKQELLNPVINMLSQLKESYEVVAAQDTSAPLMENTQTVYAGLTYGRSSLHIDLANQGTNRGFRV